MLYRQLAEESLSSFPLTDEATQNSLGEGISEANEQLQTKKSDPFSVGVNPKSPNGKCCWVDNGGTLFFDVADLRSWLQSSSDPYELLYPVFVY